MRAGEKWLRGETAVRVTGPDPAGFLNGCAAAGVDFRRPVPEDPLTLHMFIPTDRMSAARKTARQKGCELEELSTRGLPLLLRGLRKRALLSFLVIPMLLLLALSGLYIWDIQVTDNDSSVKDETILRVLSDNGIGIGTFWPGNSGEAVRARVLPELPELSWLTVNVRGSRAEVIARGAVPVPEPVREDEPAHIVASSSGVVTEIRAREGETVIQVGDSVLKGDILLSGSRAMGRNVRADGEVTARTWREITACCPLKQTISGPVSGEKHRFYILWGKRKINISGNTGILPPECDKITRIRSIALEGLFTLPVSLVSETLRYREEESFFPPEDALAGELEECLIRELERRLGDRGRAETLRFSRSVSGDTLYVTLRAECLERIDRELVYEPAPYSTEPAEDTAWKEQSRWIG